MGGSFVLSDEMECVYLDVDVSDEMTATANHESIAKTMKRQSRTEAAAILRQKASSSGKQS